MGRFIVCFQAYVVRGVPSIVYRGEAGYKVFAYNLHHVLHLGVTREKRGGEGGGGLENRDFCLT